MSERRERYQTRQDQRNHRHSKIETQEDGGRYAIDGIEVTQATVSRDIKELMLIKVPDAEGNYHMLF